MARIAIAGFMHETNCFVPDTTDFENFANPPDRSGILRGEGILETFAEKGASTAGFLNGSENNHEIAPLLWTSTTPGGYVTKNAYERIAGEIIARLSEEQLREEAKRRKLDPRPSDGKRELLAKLQGDVPVAITPPPRRGTADDHGRGRVKKKPRQAPNGTRPPPRSPYMMGLDAATAHGSRRID